MHYQHTNKENITPIDAEQGSRLHETLLLLLDGPQPDPKVAVSRATRLVACFLCSAQWTLLAAQPETRVKKLLDRGLEPGRSRMSGTVASWGLLCLTSSNGPSAGCCQQTAGQSQPGMGRR